MTDIRRMTLQYLETALWSSHDWDDMDDSDNPTHFDENYCVADFTDEAADIARKECEYFVHLLECYNPLDCNLLEQALEFGDYEQLGHDLWLTRNGHGCGFWDGDYGDIGDMITKIVDSRFSEVTPYVNSDGKVDWE